MDYCFYLKKVYQLEPQLIEDLYTHVSSTPLDITKSYFTKRHPGLDSITVPLYANTAKNNPAVNQLLDLLNLAIPRGQALSYAINRLDPDGMVLEHTDAITGLRNRGHVVSTQHMIHVSVRNGGVYGHRRDKSIPYVWQPMDQGGCYLYNNYVWHMVKNTSKQVRWTIIVYFDDPQWDHKNAIYDRYNLDRHGY